MKYLNKIGISGNAHNGCSAISGAGGNKEKFLYEGCTHYLPKPFTRDKLTSLLADILVSHN